MSFTVLATPSITSLSPRRERWETAVTITGSNFGSTQGSSTVTFNGTSGDGGDWSATSIAVTVPTGATTGNVVVNVSGVNTNGVSFTVLATPSITSLSVTSGAVGAAVTITGSNFGSTQGSSTVTFNGTTATVRTWTSDEHCGDSAHGCDDRERGGEREWSEHERSELHGSATPSITGLSVTSGAVGAAVTITGSNFGSTQGSSTVTFNGTTATVGTWSATSIAVTVPTGATTGNVVVNASGVNTNGVSFTVLATPSITSLSVTSGAVGAAVTITGSNFGSTQGSSTVTFNGTTATVGTWSATSIAVTVPTGATTGNVVVNASGVNTNGVSFTVLATPSITSLSVTSGAVGAAVTITGSNFGSTQGSSTVTFNGTTATVGTWSATSIAVTVPTGATTGNVVVTVLGASSNGAAFTVVEILSIASISPTTGAVGTEVSITGTGFGITQGNSTISLNGTSTTATNWSDTNIVAIVPLAATSGPFSVTVSGQAVNSAPFTITNLPAGWSDSDVGAVGPSGSASYANGAFTIQGSGLGTSLNSDAFHFLYQPLSGDGTIVARVTSLQGGTYPRVGVMIRETLDPAATYAQMSFYNASVQFWTRASTGAYASVQYTSFPGLPYWIKLVRSGNTFSAYASSDGVNWWQEASSQTISMAQNVFVGLEVNSYSTSSLTTTTVDSVSLSSSASAAPTITTMSATTGPIGSQVVIFGSGFSATQNGSFVTLNGAPVSINSWSTSSIVATIPAGATSGAILVSVAPSMNESNPIEYAVTNQPLPTPWLDRDIGLVGSFGSATYTAETFTVAGSGQTSSNSDAFHFVYQPLSGDGTIVARVTSLQGGVHPMVGVMIRETLDPAAAYAQVAFYNANVQFWTRTSTGAYASVQYTSVPGLPYWIKLVRSGNTFSAYASSDGVNWWQEASSQTIIMAQNVFVGLEVNNYGFSSLATATVDSVSLSSSASASPTITTVSATTGSIGSQVYIIGSGFGASQAGSAVLLNDAPTTINAWSDTGIIFTIPMGATSGPLLVSVAPNMNNSNAINFAVTAQPLPAPWLDQDIGEVGLAGSATYSNGSFAINGAGSGIFTPPDGFHFVYQPLSGDGTIVARLVNLQGGVVPRGGVQIRETLDPGARYAAALSNSASPLFYYRTTPGATGNDEYVSFPNTPPWIKLVRSSNTFSGFASLDGVNWVPLGASQTITMATNVYVGLCVDSYSSTVLATADFDGVSLSTPTATGPVISSVSATTGSIGSQVVITGSGFGSSQNGSAVTLNDAPVTINSWSNTSITITIPIGATSGPLLVSVAPNVDDSNAVNFQVTTQPLPVSWLDQDVGATGPAGSATYANGTFTVKGAGTGTWGSTSDQFHFVYQPLPGDGTIIARIVSLQGGTYPSAGVMIRETLDPAATNAQFLFSYLNPNAMFMQQRTSSGGMMSIVQGISAALPYWTKLVRSGSLFTGYVSADGVNWTQVGTPQTINMAQNAYVGLYADSVNNQNLTTATFDNVSLTIGTTPYVSGLSPTWGPLGTQVMITGSSFGTSPGTVSFNGAVATSIASWTNSQIVANVPANAPGGVGPVVVTVNSIPSLTDVAFDVINPMITSLSPPAAQVGGTVILSGIGFGASQGTSQVQFNGLVAAVRSWSDTSVSVLVPSTATNGPVTLTEDGITSNGVQFSLLEPLSITGISANIGQAGDPITITGTGFGATQSNSTVDFYGTVRNGSELE